MSITAPGRAPHTLEHRNVPLPPQDLLGDCPAERTEAGKVSISAPDIAQRVDIATWYLRNGYRIGNPFAHADDAELVAQHAMRRNRRSRPARRWRDRFPALRSAQTSLSKNAPTPGPNQGETP